jgi:hypothetical protein
MQPIHKYSVLLMTLQFSVDRGRVRFTLLQLCVRQSTFGLMKVYQLVHRF